MAYVSMTTRASGYIVLNTDWQEIIDNFAETAPGLVTTDGDIVIATGANALERVAAFGSSNLLIHERGGVEADISAITTGDTIVGQSPGVAGLETAMSQAQAEAGTETQVRGVTAERVKQAILALATANIATGTYTGDGALSLAVTGVGFAPKFVIISGRVTSNASQADKSVTFTSTVIVDDSANGMAVAMENGAGTATYDEHAIIALGADGFTVDDNGANENPNVSGAVYNYVAIG